MGRPATGHELDAPPWVRVEATLMATARAIRQNYDHQLAAIGLNLSQASLLAFVADFGPHTQSQLAARLDLGRAATGTVIDQLEGRDLVRRVGDGQDRRVWRIELTDAGRGLVAEITGIDVALREQLRAGFTRADRQQLAAMLLRLQENLRR